MLISFKHSEKSLPQLKRCEIMWNLFQFLKMMLTEEDSPTPVSTHNSAQVLTWLKFREQYLQHKYVIILLLRLEISVTKLFISANKTFFYLFFHSKQCFTPLDTQLVCYFCCPASTFKTNFYIFLLKCLIKLLS